MYKRLAALMLGLSSSLMTLPAHADEWIYGFKVSYFEPDIPNVDDPDNAGLLIGYDWRKDYGILGIEGDFTSTFEDGSLAGQDVSVDTLGIYGTYKTLGASAQGLGFYVKLKGGVIYYDVSAGAASTDDTEASFGLGVGVNMGLVSFEIEYATIEDGEIVNFMVLF